MKKITPIVDNTIVTSPQGDSMFAEIENLAKTSGQTLYPPKGTTFAVASITRVGQVATLTTNTNHNLVSKMTINVLGADQTEYNVTATSILRVSDTVLTYIVTGTPATPATGATITMIPVDDKKQLSRGVADYETSGNFYNVTGTANAVILSPQEDYEPPHKLREGTRLQFVPTVPNTGAVTVDAFGFGPSPVKKNGLANDLDAGDFNTSNQVEISFTLSSGGQYRLVHNFDVKGTGEPDTILGPQFSQNTATTTGLTFGFNAGKIRKEGEVSVVTSGTISLAANETTVIFLDTGDDTVKSLLSSSYATSVERVKLFEIVTGASTISTVSDLRAFVIDILDISVVIDGQFSQNLATTTGLTFGFKEGKLRKDGDVVVISGGTLVLPASNTSTIFLDTSDNTVKQVLTGSYTATTEKAKLFEVTTGVSSITSVVDLRGFVLDLSGIVTAISSQFAQDSATTTGLTFGFKEGKVSKDKDVVTVAAGTTLLPASQTSTVYFDADTNTVKDELNAVYDVLGIEKSKLFEVATGVSSISTVSDKRPLFHIPKRFQENLIINAAPDVWQRNDVSIAFNNNAAFTADRFRWSDSGISVVSHQTHTLGQTAVPGNPRSFWRAIRTTAVNEPGLEIIIEDIAKFSLSTLTLEFYARFASAANMNINVISNFGSGGSADVNTLIQSSFPIGTSFTRFIKTFQVPSVSGKTLGASGGALKILLSMPNTTGTFDITAVKLVRSDFISQVIIRQEPEEESLCQHFFFKTYDITVTPGTATTNGQSSGAAGNGGTALSDVVVQTSFPTPMHNIPTITFWTSAGVISNILSTQGDQVGGTPVDIGTGSVGIVNTSALTSSGGGKNDVRPYRCQIQAEAEIA